MAKLCLTCIPVQSWDVGMGISFFSGCIKDVCDSSSVEYTLGCAHRSLKKLVLYTENVAVLLFVIFKKSLWICHTSTFNSQMKQDTLKIYFPLCFSLLWCVLQSHCQRNTYEPSKKQMAKGLRKQFHWVEIWELLEMIDIFRIAYRINFHLVEAVTAILASRSLKSALLELQVKLW